MKTFITIVGIFLIIFGITAISYQNISFTQQEKIAEIGKMQVMKETQKTLHFSPLVCGVSIVTGLLLVGLGRWK